MRRRLLWIISSTTLFWLCAVIAVDQFGKLDQARSADVIVVLGSRVYPGGIPGPAPHPTGRGTQLFYGSGGLAPVVICSGGIGQGERTAFGSSGRPVIWWKTSVFYPNLFSSRSERGAPKKRVS